MARVTKKRTVSEKQLAKYREQIAIRKAKAALALQKKTQIRKQTEKYQNIFKKEIESIMNAYKTLPPLKKAQLSRAIKQNLRKYQTLVTPEQRYGMTGIESIDEFLKRLNAIAKWDNYSKLLFIKVVSLAERHNVLVRELSSWASPVINDMIGYSDQLRSDAETILNLFYQYEGGVISIDTLQNNIQGIIGS